MVGLNSRTWFSHGSKGWRHMIEVSMCLVSPENDVPCVHKSTSVSSEIILVCGLCLCPSLPFFMENSHICCGSAHFPSSCLKRPIYKQSRSGGLKDRTLIYEFGNGEHNPTQNNLLFGLSWSPPNIFFFFLACQYFPSLNTLYGTIHYHTRDPAQT